ncbi:hypothetical protein CMO90_02810 [Candidatus Woesearchaeota archaeon]|jgi:secondary thiamine-phosphate synthase enzyme|nr:hypothetical protein [Candidatus Woesearchaeota archaeon]|tara:strand:- start:2165 stop:2566 length:402 start_codon:yes stop_codon:yes gene_type:complete
MVELRISSTKQEELIDITSEVNKLIKDSSVANGLCNVFTTHSTSAVLINENYDSNVCKDFLKAINEAIPKQSNYLHDQIDNNASAHIKAALIGPQESIPIRDKCLKLGTWQSLMFADFDGPKKRIIVISILND